VGRKFLEIEERGFLPKAATLILFSGNGISLPKPPD
jgi:hypothetical protein